MEKNFLLAWFSSIAGTLASLTLDQMQYIAAAFAVFAGLLACIAKLIEIVTKWTRLKHINRRKNIAEQKEDEERRRAIESTNQ